MSKFDFKSLATMDVKDLFKKKESEPREKVAKPMQRPVVSFEFGASTIKVAEGRMTRGQLKVTKLFSIETPMGAIEDGKIVDQTLLVKALETGLNVNGVKARDAICTINSTQIINRELLIPLVAEDEVETVVRFEIQKFLPVNLEDYLVQYVKLSELEVNGAPKIRLNVITFPQKMGYAYYELMKELGLKPYVLDVSYNAVSKLADYTNTLSRVTHVEGTVAFIDMGASSLDVNIFNHGNVQFTRIIKSGCSIIENKLSELSNISIKSAVSLKEDVADLEKHSNLTTEQVVIQHCVDELILDLERVLQFYRNKQVGNQIDHVFIMGGGSKIKGIAPYMEEKLGVKTSLFNVLDGIDVNAVVPESELPLYLTAIGAMIRR